MKRLFIILLLSGLLAACNNAGDNLLSQFEANDNDGICEIEEVGSDCDGLCLSPIEDSSLDCGPDGHVMEGISITPLAVVLPILHSTELISVGRFEGGRTSNISRYVEWRSSDASVVSVSVPEPNTENVALITGKALAEANVSSSLGGINSDEPSMITVSNETPILTSVDVVASQTVIPLGLPSQVDMILSFSGGSTFSTKDTLDDSNFVSWSITPADTGAVISAQGLLNTANMAAGESLTITGMGVNALQGATDFVIITVTNASLANPPEEDILANNSSGRLTIAKGLPIKLDMSALFSDGIRRSTLELDNSTTASLVDFEITSQSLGANIVNGRELNTSNMFSTGELTITGTGKGAYAGLHDTVIITVTNEVLAPAAAADVTANGISDKLSIPKGLPIKLNMSALFTDNTRHSTDNLDNNTTAHLVVFEIISNNLGATIVDGRELNTNTMVAPGTITILGTGIGAYEGASDTVEITVNNEVPASPAAEDVTANNASGNLTISQGLPIKLDASAIFTDDIRYSTQDLDNEATAEIVSFTLTGDSLGASIVDGREINTHNMTTQGVLIVTGSGRGVYADLTDTVAITVTNSIPANPANEDVIANGHSNQLNIGKGLPIKLDMSALYSDGTRHTTVDLDNDTIGHLVHFYITGESFGAYISNFRELNTTSMTSLETVMVTGSGRGAYGDISDTVAITVTDAVIASPANENVTANTVSDNLTIALGLPIKLDMSALFTDDTRHSTVDLTNTATAALIDFEFVGNDYGASIVEGRELNTLNMSGANTLTIIGIGLGTYADISDTVTINVTDAVIASPADEEVAANGLYDNLTIALGLPIKLDISALFTDGTRHSTNDLDNATTATLVDFEITGESFGAYIVEGRELNTASMTNGGALLITGTGLSSYAGVSDTVSIFVTNAIIASPAEEDVTANDVSDNFSIALGLPIKLDMSSLFTDNTRHSTKNLSNAEAAALVDFEFVGDDHGATIVDGREINTIGMSGADALTIIGIGIGTYTTITDTVTINVLDAVIATPSDEDVTANNTSNSLTVDRGETVKLDMSALFTDGTRHSTDALGNTAAAQLVNFGITGSDFGAVIINGRELDTSAVAPTGDNTITVTGTGLNTFTGAVDTVDIVVQPPNIENARLVLKNSYTRRSPSNYPDCSTAYSETASYSSRLELSATPLAPFVVIHNGNPVTISSQNTTLRSHGTYIALDDTVEFQDGRVLHAINGQSVIKPPLPACDFTVTRISTDTGPDQPGDADDYVISGDP